MSSGEQCGAGGGAGEIETTKAKHAGGGKKNVITIKQICICVARLYTSDGRAVAATMFVYLLLYRGGRARARASERSVYTATDERGGRDMVRERRHHHHRHTHTHTTDRVHSRPYRRHVQQTHGRGLLVRVRRGRCRFVVAGQPQPVPVAFVQLRAPGRTAPVVRRLGRGRRGRRRGPVPGHRHLPGARPRVPGARAVPSGRRDRRPRWRGRATGRGRTETAAQLHRANRHGHTRLGRGQARAVRHLPVHTGQLSVLPDARPGLAELDPAQSVAERLFRQGRSVGQRQGPLLGHTSGQRGRLQEGRLPAPESATQSAPSHGPGRGRRR